MSSETQLHASQVDHANVRNHIILLLLLLTQPYLYAWQVELRVA
jgi:hypothetical protein